MLGLSSSCDATVRLTRKASIPEKPDDVKEFVSLSGNCFRSEIVFDSDIAFAAILRCSDICPVGKLWINTLTSAKSRNIILAIAKI